MSRLVLSPCCGLTPLRARRRGSAITLPSPPHLAVGPLRPAAASIHPDWALRVSAPTRLVSIFDDDKNSSRGEEKASGSSSEEFDPGAPPPFTLADIRAAIPKHCWVRDTWRSMSYVVRDFAVVFGLAAAAARFDSWLVWPFYWIVQGTMFWALFVIAHDCFSKDRNLNSLVGHILNAPTLVPYHGWRISHRTHHQNQGHVEKDESWNPLPQRMYNSLDNITKIMRFTLPFPMLAFPVYLFIRSPGKTGSHFHPNSDVFLPNEKKDVLTSTASCLAMVWFLGRLTFVMGPLMMLRLYVIPYVVFIMWLDFVTYLNHHGHRDKIPWYRGKEWSYLRGGLTTIDRDYGLINNIHHDISTHVIHHLFPQIPHYHLVEATEAAKPVLGKYYREPEKSGPLPFHLLKELCRSLKNDRYVSDTGEVVYYQSDPEMSTTNSSH